MSRVPSLSDIPRQEELTITAVPEVRGRIVTTPDGRLLRRVGGDSQPIRGDAMARFVRERELRSGEDEPIVLVHDQAFSLDAINQALAADGRAPVGQAQLPRELREVMPEADAGALLARAEAKGLWARIGTRGGSRYTFANAIVQLAGGSGPAHTRVLLNEIRRRGSLSTTEAVKLIGAPPATVRSLLNQLAQAGLVRAEGNTRGRRYYNIIYDIR